MENQDINEESINNQEETNTQNPSPAEDNVTAKPTAEELLAEEKDRYIRLYAEFENYKKRTAKEKMEYFQFANQEMMVSMLGILDDFERALKEIAKNGNPSDVQGVELIYQKFKNKLSEKGLKAMDVKPGDSFNVDFHEAITQIPAPSEDLKGKIVDVVETGYTLNDKVIRFAKVVTGN
ncbi:MULTISPECIES: nucleotide exchange factor GrpE [Chryseobacterium]|uniref:Protein GrpE n=1 Tax=Chryseobacterium camelliae TaxID=1265445 RepID=A0ABU0TEG6_9FLAO|nr:molecular chaperone GrpE [Chryseobacterium camelliae]MDQ1099397.1 molecular chaperone GrpE [Chryseobacterium sp. SORGH_AS_1048]MDR6086743.1 molecular chaperone GrpE [Chryseobacterium sp. SORGH_AS_0909]MDR6131115.1 molecular chaperone GrpE [Chryseobacterium sp. SORGH_AS_1175]MDT3406745.1 molecular chaperone GrpE [Pseudacidovorax intermedius]